MKSSKGVVFKRQQRILQLLQENHEMSVEVDWEYEKGTKKIVIHNALKTGDKVILARIQGGQSYIILDKAV